jgi:hypothetical protein
LSPVIPAGFFLAAFLAFLAIGLLVVLVAVFVFAGEAPALRALTAGLALVFPREVDLSNRAFIVGLGISLLFPSNDSFSAKE